MKLEATMALLAAGSYWDIRGNAAYDANEKDESNHAPIPEGWRLLTLSDKSVKTEISGSGDNALPGGSGFSARAYQRIGTNEVVIGYATTEANPTSHFFSSRPQKAAACTSKKFLACRMNS